MRLIFEDSVECRTPAGWCLVLTNTRCEPNRVRQAQSQPPNPPSLMRVPLPLWPRPPQLKPALVNGTLALWPSPNGSMIHIKAHKNDLPICQEVEQTKLILVWKFLKSLTNPPSFYSVARKVDYPGLKPMLMTISQPSRKRKDIIFFLYSLPQIMKPNRCCSQPLWYQLKPVYTLLDVHLLGQGLYLFLIMHIYLWTFVLVALLAIPEWVKIC